MRPVAAGDEQALQELLEGLSPESVFLRFFTAGANLRSAAQAAASGEPGRHGLVAVGCGRIIGHAELVEYRPGVAEVAFEVAESWHGLGVGTILLGHLVQGAAERGIATLTAVVRADNWRMLDVFRESGLAVEVDLEPGELHLTMAATLDRGAQERFAYRERTAAVAGVRTVLAPASVAVVGASARPDSIGGLIVANLVAMGFHGEISVVHPRRRSVHGVRAHRSLARIRPAPELVVIAVPAEDVCAVARDAAAAGARALVVVSAGFRESGRAGAARERELLGICREAGMRLVGPNCLGVVNTAGDVALDACFSRRLPQPGRVALLSQSGALGIAAIEAAAEQGLGLSAFASIGNCADLAPNDFLRYWEQDAGTGVVLLYVESFGNPRTFARVARRMAHDKPVVVVTGGRSRAGARAAQSHTGALLRAGDALIDALCRAGGVVRTGGLAELFDVGRLLAAQPAPAGRRVAIVTNGGGLGILCADACAAAGLEVPVLSERVQRSLRRALGRGPTVANPVDLLGGARRDAFAAAVPRILRSGEADIVLVLGVRTAVVDTPDIAEELERVATGAGPTLGAVLIPRPDPVPGGRVPTFAFPEDAARAAARAADYGIWRRTPRDAPPAPDPAATDAGAAVIAAALRRGPGWLTPAECDELLAAHGISRVVQRVVASPAAAGRAAAEIGAAVALKAVAPGLLHKSDAGAVETGLRGPVEVARRARAMRARLRRAGYTPEGFVVQAMAPEGIEVLVGAAHDDRFGPLVLCGAGGTMAELLSDSTTRLAPIGRSEARAMLQELRSFPLLGGWRGAPPADVAALEDVLVRVAGLAAAHPQVAELDLNPVIAGPRGAVVADVRMRVEPLELPLPVPNVDSMWNLG